MIVSPSPSPCALSRTDASCRSYADFVAMVQRVQSAVSQIARPGDRLLLTTRDRYHVAAVLLAMPALGTCLRIQSKDPSLPTSTLRLLKDGTASGEDLDVRAFDEQAIESSGPLDCPVESDEPFLELTTSGSDGSPRVIEKTPRQLFSEAMMHRELLGVRSDARILSTASPEHIYGLLFTVLLPLVSGASLSRETPHHAASILGSLSSLAATHLITLPVHLKALQSELMSRSDLKLPKSLRTVISSGAELPPALATAFAERGLRVIDVLGSTETGGIASREPATSELYEPLPCVRVDVGLENALLLDSPFLPTGTGRYECADRVQLENGKIRYLGRRDRIVKVGGTRVSLAELVRIARGLAQVDDAFAFAKDDPGDLRGTAIYLVIVSQARERAELWQELRRALPDALLPRHLCVVRQAPTDDRGKVTMSCLEALFATSEKKNEQRVELRGLRAPVCEGHFEGEPIVPGAVVIEDLVLSSIARSFSDLRTPKRLLRVRFPEAIAHGALVNVSLCRRDNKVDFEVYVGASPRATGTVEYPS